MTPFSCRTWPAGGWQELPNQPHARCHGAGQEKSYCEYDRMQHKMDADNLGKHCRITPSVYLGYPDGVFESRKTNARICGQSWNRHLSRANLRAVDGARTARGARGGEMKELNMEEDTNWKEDLTEAMAQNGETWADVEAHTLTDKQLNTRFDHGYGGTLGAPFTLWTKKRVYFPGCYDGSEWVSSVSRNPDGKATEHVGGG